VIHRQVSSARPPGVETPAILGGVESTRAPPRIKPSTSTSHAIGCCSIIATRVRSGLIPDLDALRVA
jgi:hypothetical protein